MHTYINICTHTHTRTHTHTHTHVCVCVCVCIPQTVICGDQRDFRHVWKKRPKRIHMVDHRQHMEHMESPPGTEGSYLDLLRTVFAEEACYSVKRDLLKS
jgi:hypothetical protein